MERFIQDYLRRVGGILTDGQRLVFDAARRFLAQHEYNDFKNADQFADELLDYLETEYAVAWDSIRSRQTINDVVRKTYEFYRLRDLTPFGDASPIGLRLGGPDRVSIEFIQRLDHFYFSRFGGNTSKPLRKFFVERYFENGAALFGRETSEELQDFRDALGDKFKNLTDRQVKTIVQTAVQRVRNWAHIGTLDQAGFELARVVATLDSRTTELCRELDGKLLRVGVAQKTIERLNQLEPGEFARELYESKIGKAISKEPVATVTKFLEADGKTISDQLVETGRGFPPYHANCRTRLEGVFEEE